MKKHEKLELDGDTYSIEQLGAVEGRRLLVKLTKSIAPVFGDLATFEKLNEQAILSTLGAALETLDPDLVDELCGVFARHTKVRYQEQFVDLAPRLDDHFAGRYLSLSKFVWAHLKLNFADFLGGSQLTSALSAIKERTTASESQTPTNTSGA